MIAVVPQGLLSVPLGADVGTPSAGILRRELVSGRWTGLSAPHTDGLGHVDPVLSVAPQGPGSKERELH